MTKEFDVLELLVEANEQGIAKFFSKNPIEKCWEEPENKEPSEKEDEKSLRSHGGRKRDRNRTNQKVKMKGKSMKHPAIFPSKNYKTKILMQTHIAN